MATIRYGLLFATLLLVESIAVTALVAEKEIFVEVLKIRNSIPCGSGSCDGDFYDCCDNGCALKGEQCCDPLSVYCPSLLYCPTTRIDSGQQLYCYTDSARQTTAALAFTVINPSDISAVSSAFASATATSVTGPTQTPTTPSAGSGTATGAAPSASSSKAAAPGSAFETVRFDILVLVMLLAGLGIVLL